jgi:hypothetical protein
MPTFMHALLWSLEERWKEVDVLLDHALEEEEEGDHKFYDVLCRSAVVLIAAHLEGFVRDCANALIEDINRFSTFKQLTPHVKRTFCNLFIKADDAESNVRAERLVRIFDDLDTKLKVDPFLFGGKNDDYKNASPGMIHKVSKNFGVDKIFGLFAGSRLEVVFKGLPSEVSELSLDLRDHLLNHIDSFYYSVDAEKFGLVRSGMASTKGGTLWESFLDDLISRRNTIAHGASQLDGSSVGEIRDIKEKVVIFQYGFMLVLCGALQ